MIRRMKVKMAGRALFPWHWFCPCCVNSPGRAGYSSLESAYADAIGHAKEWHPAPPDWETLWI